MGYQVYQPDRVTPFRDEDLPLTRAMHGESRDQVELYIAYPTREDGTFITVTGRPLKSDQGTIEGGVVVFHDITRRKKAESRLAAQFRSTQVLAEVDSPSHANARIIETICECLDWEIGLFWRVDPYAKKLRCATYWQRQKGASVRFEKQCRGLILEEGADLPGRAWESCQPVWTTDLTAEPDGPRRDAAEEDSLRAAFAIPIKLKEECLGVLEFVTKETRAVDPAVIEMMMSLGTQLGQLMERYRMRGRVAQSEKLASLGLLSAGVAHEINNPLAYIANNLAVLERDVRFLMSLVSIYETGHRALEVEQPEVLHSVTRMADEFDLDYVNENMGKLISSTRQGVNRVADIVQSLRGFARVDRMAVDEADVRDAVRSAIEMIQARLVRRNIRVDEHLGTLPRVTGSPAQLNQVFLNLLVNAMQAIEATHRVDGQIVLTSSTSHGEVIVEVADNGCGISEEVLPQIFDPFFTTKSVGDGTGLGLSITHSMVQDHGGRLEVESIMGEGTRFRVILPVAGLES
jgi:signal transduction histidine kinase